ncbi:VCBS domain-containing protein, partial [Pseudomonas stutzeri]|nr:VCBS domain-containing protein [Stutzerimonas stutzeri]
MGDNNNPTPSTNPETSPAAPASRLIRRSPRPLALEQRFVFDGAAAAEVVEAGSSMPEPSTEAPAAATVDPLLAAYAAVDARTTSAGAPDAAPSSEPLFRLASEHAVLGEAAETASSALQRYLQEASDAQLFELFNGGQAAADAQWLERLAELRAAIDSGELALPVRLLDNAQLQGALAAYAGEGPGGAATIFLNGDWLSMLDASRISQLLIEEYGHHIDRLLNPDADTPGDEGQRFAAAVTGADSSAPGFATDNDRRTLQIDGESIEVELAQLSFGNAYAVNVATTPAGKESNSHDFVFTSLGTATISDDTASHLFSGNDVAAIGISIGGEEYFGWISRPIKSNGVVRGFYFWTDTDFVDLATAQADGNMDGDRNVADNLGFLLVVDQAFFDGLGWKDQAANLKNVGSSSDRVDSALNALIPGPVAPVAVADTAIAVEAGGASNATPGSNASGNLLDNDSDANGDTLTVTAVNGSAIASGGSLVVSGQYGQLTLGANGAYTYVVDNANAAVQALRSSANTLSETFTYRISDGNGGSATSTLTVTIQGANDNPTARHDYNVAKESLLSTGAYGAGDPLGSQATGNVLGNDSDPDRYGETKAVTGVAIEGAATGTTTATQTILSFTTLPSNVSVGYYVFLDGDGLDNDKNAGTALRDANGNQITISSIDTTAKTFTLSGTVANATLTQNGSQLLGFANNSGGTAAYKDEYIQSSTNAAGTQVSISAAQGSIAVGMSVGGTGLATAPTVTAVNYDASGNIGSITLSSAVAISNQALTFSAGATAGATLTGQYGSLQLNADGSYTYTPTANNPALAAGQSVVERFDYTMRDGAGATSSASLFITVLGSGSTDPNAVADSATATERGGVANASAGVNPSGNLLSNDSTPSGTSGLAISTIRGIGAAPANATSVTAAGIEINGLYGKLSLNNAGIYSYILDNDNPVVQALRDSSDRLSETFVYTVTNSSGMKDSATFTITVQGANDAPLASDDSAIAVEAGGINNSSAGYDPSGNVLSNDSDVDDLPSELRVTAVRTGGVEGAGSAGSLGNALAGSYGWLTLNANGNWTYVVDQSNAMVNALAPGETLTERFNYTVTDRSGSGLSDTAVLTITIQGARDSVAVNDVFVNEASPYAVFTVSGGVGVQVALALDTAGLPASDVRATLGTDVGSQIQYLDGSNWVAYDAGNPPSIPIGGQLLVRVAVLQDDVHEGNESFRLIATTSDGSQSAGIGTINDEGEGDVFLAGNTSGTPDSAALDDDRPTLSVANVSVSEGDPAEFVVSIDKAATTPISFSPVLASGTAIVGSDTAAASALQYHDGSDWVTVSGPVSIAAGELSVRLRIATVDDSEVEPDQTFSLSTGNVSGTVTNPLGASGTATIIDNDTPVAGAPELDLDANDSSTASGADYLTFFTENGSAVSIADSDLLIVDADSTNLASATIVLTNAKAGDSLDVGPLPTGISASIDTSVAGQITVTLSGTASKADYQAALRAVTFSNSSDAPDTSDRLVVVKVSDGVNESNSALTTIRVVAVNDAPLLADTALSLSVAEDAGAPSGAVGSPLSAFTGGISDPDGDVPKGIAIIGSDETHGTWYYSTDGGSSWQSVGSVSATSALLLADNPNTRLYFQPADDFNGSIASGLTFKAWDQSSGTVGSRADTTPPTQADSYTSSEPVVIPSSGSTGSITLTSSQTVSGLKGPVTGVTVTLNGLTHGWPQDLDILLVGPQGQKVMLMSDAGGEGGNAFSNLTLTFDDAAASALPGVGQPLSSGTFRPTDLADEEGGDSFTGVSGPFASQLAEFIGTDPNGQWTLYISDDVVQFDGGSLASWTLTLHTPIDGSAFSTASDSIAVTVTPINDAPLASGSASLAPVDEDDTDPPGASVSSLFTARFDDSTDQVDGGSSANSLAGIAITGYTADAAKGDWQYSIDNGTSWITLSGIAGDSSALTLQASTLLRFLPAADYNGAAPDLTVRLIDSTTTVANAANVDASLNGGSTAISAQTVTLSTSVTAMPDPAVIAGEDSGAVTEDADVDADGKLTDSGTLTINDADAGEAAFQTTVSAAPGTFGSLSLDASGAWTYSVSNSAVQYLKAGETKLETFTVTALDGTEHTISITINGVNDAPVGANANVTTAEDTPVSGQVTASDVDGDSLTFAKASDPAHGSVTVAADGSWTYTPDQDYHGSDSFTVEVSDGQGGSDTITVNVTITPVNDAPVAQNDAVTVSEDVPFSSSISLLANDSDVDGDSLSVVAGTFVTAQGGSIVIAADGSYTYTPPADFHGTDTVDYTVTDGSLTDTATLTLTVTPV